MAKAQLDDIIVALEEWVESCLDPDKPLIPIGEGRMLSPRQFLEEIKNETDLGKRMRADLVRIGTDLIKGIYQPFGICP